MKNIYSTIFSSTLFVEYDKDSISFYHKYF